jgi:hypothetical protein
VPLSVGPPPELAAVADLRHINFILTGKRFFSISV